MYWGGGYTFDGFSLRVASTTRASMSGTDETQLPTALFSQDTGFSIDFEASRVYWSQPRSVSIASVSLGDGNVTGTYDS